MRYDEMDRASDEVLDKYKNWDWSRLLNLSFTMQLKTIPLFVARHGVSDESVSVLIDILRSATEEMVGLIEDIKRSVDDVEKKENSGLAEKSGTES